MPEVESAEGPEASLSHLRRVGAIRPGLVACGILLALALAVVTLRLYRLGDIPPGALLDEGIHGVNALQVLRGEHAVFFPQENDGLEGLMAYAVALTTALLGRTVLALRLPAALASAGSVYAVFWLGWLLFREAAPGGKANPWRGIFVGGVGASLLAVSLGQTIIGRTALRANLLPLLLTSSFALLWWGWRKRSTWPIVVAGVCAGVLPYTYYAAYFVPILFTLFGLSFLPLLGSATIERSGAGLLRGQIARVFLFVSVASLVAAPILVYAALNLDDFFSRSSQVSVFHSSRNLGDALRILLINVWEHLLAFGVLGDRYWWQNLPGHPMLNAVEALIFWLGVVISISRWRRPAYRLLLLWLGVMLLPAMLSRDSVPNTLRMIGATPAIYLLAAAGAWEIFRILKEMLPMRGRFWAAIGMGVMVPGLLLLKGLNTHRIFFQEWAAAHQVYEAYEVEWTELTRSLNALPPTAGTVYLIPDGQRQIPLKEGFRSYTFDYLYQVATPAYLFHTAMPDFVHRIESRLAAVEDLSTVRVVEWNLDNIWTGDEDERFAILLRRYGRFLESEDYGEFVIHSYTDISLDRPWKLYDHLEPRTVDYDGGISLQGLALGRGEEQLSSQQTLTLGEDRVFWLALQWQTDPGLSIDYAISLRLHDAEGSAVYYKDEVLWKADHTNTGSRGSSQLFDTPFLVEVPADLLPGDYELRLIVYDAASLKPTVELDVWEPEVTLARIRMAAAP